MTTRYELVRSRPPLPEAAWTTWVVDVAQLHGWRVTHFRPARTAGGRWRTPLQGHAGFPDLVLARDGVIIMAELKTDTGRLTSEQRAWLAALGAAARVWRPRDRGEVLAALGAPRHAGAGSPGRT